MEMLVTVIHIIVALFMILVVLVQGGNQGGIGAAFGGGNSQGMFGASGATTFLGKVTYGAAFIFMITTISLTIMQGQGANVGLEGKLKKAAEQHSTTDGSATENKTETPVEQPAETPAPATENKAE